MVLPHPDSPTMPSVRPGASARSTLSTARSMPRGVGRVTDTPSIESNAALITPYLQGARPRIGQRAQGVADDVERQHREEHHRRRHKGQPWRDVEALAALADHAAPA